MKRLGASTRYVRSAVLAAGVLALAALPGRDCRADAPPDAYQGQILVASGEELAIPVRLIVMGPPYTEPRFGDGASPSVV